MNRAGREGWAFIFSAVTLAGAVVYLFSVLYPNVMPVSNHLCAVAHDLEREQHGLHAQDHDDRGHRVHPDRAGLPELDVLGVPQAGFAVADQ